MADELERLGVSDRDRVVANQIKKFAGWAAKMTNDEVIMTALRARDMGVHPLNDKAFYAYKDQHGIHTGYHYNIIIKYVSKILRVQHTQPVYFRLTGGQLEDEGLSEDTVAYYATFILKSDLNDYYEAVGRVGKEEAFNMFARRGIGSCSVKDWESHYFAPNGRSKAWKVQKRALADAYARSFGYPSPEEAAAIQAASWETPTDESFDVIEAETARNAVALAALEDSVGSSTLDAEERREAVSALWGPTSKHETVEGELVDGAQEKPLTFDEACAKTTPGQTRFDNLTTEQLDTLIKKDYERESAILVKAGRTQIAQGVGFDDLAGAFLYELSRADLEVIASEELTGELPEAARTFLKYL